MNNNGYPTYASFIISECCGKSINTDIDLWTKCSNCGIVLCEHHYLRESVNSYCKKCYEEMIAESLLSSGGSTVGWNTLEDSLFSSEQEKFIPEIKIDEPTLWQRFKETLSMCFR